MNPWGEASVYHTELIGGQEKERQLRRMIIHKSASGDKVDGVTCQNDRSHRLSVVH